MIILDADQGIVECRPRRRKVAIVGAGPGREYAPYTDSAWECWSLNEIAQRDAQRHFELHPLEVQSARDLAALERITIPCYVLDDPALWKMPFTIASNGGTVSFAGVPHPVRYPLERLRAAGFREYFTCTFAYQCALAILDGFDLGLAGALVDRLLEDKSVSFASADYDHPTTCVPVIKIKARDAKASLSKAVAALKKEVAEFSKELDKA